MICRINPHTDGFLAIHFSKILVDGRTAMAAVRPASLTSIAATAGVSVSTVSKVLNGRSDVAPRTRERVGRILRQKGYQVAARFGTPAVDLLIGHLGSPWAD
jgi:hypothetical protein